MKQGLLGKNSRYRGANRPRNPISDGSFYGHEGSERRKPRANRTNTYQQLIDKYTNMARDSLGVGDRVAAEFHYQYVDHYLRLLNEESQQDRFPRQMEKPEKPKGLSLDSQEIHQDQVREGEDGCVL